jgi:hypothetical protein
MFNRLLWLSFGFLSLVLIHLCAQYTIEIEKVQLARSLAAVVLDSADSPIPGVLVEEFSSDWKESLRSTKTDATGGFTFAPVKGRDVYYLQLRMNGFDPLRVRVKIDPKQGKILRLGSYYIVYYAGQLLLALYVSGFGVYLKLLVTAVIISASGSVTE